MVITVEVICGREGTLDCISVLLEASLLELAAQVDSKRTLSNYCTRPDKSETLVCSDFISNSKLTFNDVIEEVITA